MIPEPDAEESRSQDSTQWWTRLAADLAADIADQRKTWGDIDEIILARYDARKCTKKERSRVEQAMRDFPAVREALEIARQFPLEYETQTTSRRNVWDAFRTSLAAFRAGPRLRFQLSIIVLFTGIIILIIQHVVAPVAPRSVAVGADSRIGASGSSEELAFPPVNSVFPPLFSISRGAPPSGRQGEIDAMALLFREAKRGRQKP